MFFYFIFFILVYSFYACKTSTFVIIIGCFNNIIAYTLQSLHDYGSELENWTSLLKQTV